MVTRAELEGMRQELRELSREQARLRAVQEKALDDFHRQWKEKLSYVRVTATNRIKPFQVDKKKAQEKAQASLVSRLNGLDEERKKAVKAAEQAFKDGKVKAIDTCQREIEKALEEFNRHSNILTKKYNSDIAGCENERSEALETLKEEHRRAVEVLEERAAEVQKKMSVAGAA